MATPNIANEVVVITGASSGIGESTARLLAGEGAKVVLAARRKDRIDYLVEDIRAAGGGAIGFKTDVTQREQVERLVRNALNEHDRIDVMVNNSGIMQIAPMGALKVDEWDRMIDVNIKGPLYGIAAVLPTMQRQQSGHIINTASVVGFKVLVRIKEGCQFSARSGQRVPLRWRQQERSCPIGLANSKLPARAS